MVEGVRAGVLALIFIINFTYKIFRIACYSMMSDQYYKDKRAPFPLLSTPFPGRYQQAEADLTRVLELQPDFIDAQLNLNQVKKDIASGRQFNTCDGDTNSSTTT